MIEAKKENLKAVIVQEKGPGRFTQEITVNDHVLIADEPVANGGNDLGPSPYDFILAGLGACTSMTVRMYADYKKIPLEKIKVKLTHQKIHAQDCVDCEKSNAKIDHINRYIELSGNLDEAQRARLLQIANQCPVHRTLTSTITINTELLEK